MKKTMICIGIISMFLLTSLISVNASDINNLVKKQNDDYIYGDNPVIDREVTYENVEVSVMIFFDKPLKHMGLKATGARGRDIKSHYSKLPIYDKTKFRFLGGLVFVPFPIGLPLKTHRFSLEYSFTEPQAFVYWIVIKWGSQANQMLRIINNVEHDVENSFKLLINHEKEEGTLRDDILGALLQQDVFMIFYQPAYDAEHPEGSMISVVDLSKCSSVTIGPL
jgi:hypothetical protein